MQNLEQHIAVIDRRLGEVLRKDPHCQVIAAIPGVGVLPATAAVAAMGDPRSFKSGREFTSLRA